jgi:uncharacterized protein with GYD domain
MPNRRKSNRVSRKPNARRRKPNAFWRKPKALLNHLSSQSPAELMKAHAKKHGIELKEQLWCIGADDGVIIFDAADDETPTAAMLSLSMRGNVTTQTFALFPGNGSRQDPDQADVRVFLAYSLHACADSLRIPCVSSVFLAYSLRCVPICLINARNESEGGVDGQCAPTWPS